MTTNQEKQITNPEHPTAGIIVIGNEILSGKVQDSNSPFLCKELRFLGVDVKRLVTLPDEIDVIGSHVREYSKDFTWVYTTGGIGPTHDDVTIEAIAHGFGVDIEESEKMVQVLEGYYGNRLNDAHLRMAIIPKGAELMELPSMRSPQLKFHNIFVFPGVPELVRNRFFSLKEMFRSGEIFLKMIYLNTEEGQIARALDSTCAEFPELMLGSYPALWNKDYSVKLTLESKKEAYLNLAMKFLISKIPKEHIIRCE